MKRIQKKHFYDYSWKSNPNAVYVGRGKGEIGKWGNPFKLSEYRLDDCLLKYQKWLDNQLMDDPDFLKPLIGKDLVCFCPLNQRCHADILIEYIEELYGE